MAGLQLLVFGTLILGTTATILGISTGMCNSGGTMYASGRTWMSGCYRCTCIVSRIRCIEINCKCPGPQMGICGGIAGLRCPTGTLCQFWQPPHISDRAGKCCLRKGNCISNGKIYTNGQSFKIKCNMCKCSNGAIDCTKKYCGGGKGCITSDGKRYPDGSSWKVDCNTCWCKNGAISCTLIGCIGNSCISDGKKYPDGSSWKVDCNTCWCKNGVATCTKMGCIDDKTCTFNGTVYKSGQKWFDGCNNCICIQGLPGCSKKACGNCNYKGLVYTSGSSWKVDCNTCTCTNRVVSCTEMECSDKPCKFNGTVYENGEKWFDGCNNCICYKGGAACSKKACGNCFSNGLVYTSGSSWKVDCNTCSCMDKVVLCTKMSCPKTCYYKSKKYPSQVTLKFKCYNCKCDGGTWHCTKITPCNPCKYGVSGGSCGGFSPKPVMCPKGWTCNYEGNHPFIADAPGVCCRDKPVPPKTCSYNGKTYIHGATMPLKCFNCTCDDGSWDCTKVKDCNPCKYGTSIGSCGGFRIKPVYCPEGWTCNYEGNHPLIADAPGVCCRDKPKEKKCYYNGKAYAPGATLSIKCFNCHCDDGSWNCTKKPCSICAIGQSAGSCGGFRLHPVECKSGYVCSYEHNHPNLADAPGVCCLDEDIYKKTCKYDGKTYYQGDILSLKCFKCVCDKGYWDCSKRKCNKCDYGKPGVSCSASGGKYSVGQCAQGWTCNFDHRHPMLANSPGVCCRDKPIPGTCTHNGRDYSNGDTWRDGCNTCTCLRGIPVCTKRYCFSPCRYDGKRIKHNGVLRLKCFTCYCDDGFLDCEEKDCDICRYGEPGRQCGSYSLYPRQCPSGWSCNYDDVDPTLMDRPGVCCRDSPDYGCEYKGKKYRHNQRFILDDCSKCKCKKGKVNCRRRKCRGSSGGSSNSNYGNCKYNGKWYKNGSLWSDGCKQCSCAYGTVICAKSECGCTFRGKMYKHGAVMKRGWKKCCVCKNGRKFCGRNFCY